MKHTYRFFADFTENQWNIDPADIIHITKVLRLKNGDAVEVFNGNGKTAVGTINVISGKKVEFIPKQSKSFEKKDHVLAIGIGALKPGFIDDILPPLIELDVDEVHVFLQNATAKSRLNEKVRERWNKITISSCKQCKRPFLPKIYCWQSAEEMIANELISNFNSKFILIPNADLPLIKADGYQQNTIAIIGGEKGFSDSEESSLLKFGFQAVNLGETILRAYTAGIAVASILSAKKKFL